MGSRISSSLASVFICILSIYCSDDNSYVLGSDMDPSRIMIFTERVFTGFVTKMNAIRSAPPSYALEPMLPTPRVSYF